MKKSLLYKMADRESKAVQLKKNQELQIGS